MPDLKMKVSCLEAKVFYFSAIIAPSCSLKKSGRYNAKKKLPSNTRIGFFFENCKFLEAFLRN